MPAGEITNLNILEAINQTVQAINNLAERLGKCNETHSGACGGCGGCNAGTIGGSVPSPSTVGSDPPPTGWSVHSSVTFNRRCRVANAIHENIKAWVHTLDEHGADKFVNQVIPLVFTLFMALLAVWIEELGVVVTLIDATVGDIAGYLLGQAISLYRGDVDLEELFTQLSVVDDQQDYVCALYEPDGTQSVITSYLAVCEAKGISIANRDMVAAILTFDLANYLFWSKEQFIEDQLEAYAPTIPCDSCEQPVWYNCIFGTITAIDDSQVYIDAVLADDSNYFVGLGVVDPEEWGVSQSGGTLTIPEHLPEATFRWSDNVGASCTVGYIDAQWDEVLDHYQLGTYPSITAFAIRSSTPFSMRIQRL